MSSELLFTGGGKQKQRLALSPLIAESCDITSDLVKRAWEHKNKLSEGFIKEYDADKLVCFGFNIWIPRLSMPSNVVIGGRGMT